jgi:hypothetical protein
VLQALTPEHWVEQKNNFKVQTQHPDKKMCQRCNTFIMQLSLSLVEIVGTCSRAAAAVNQSSPRERARVSHRAIPSRGRRSAARHAGRRTSLHHTNRDGYSPVFRMLKKHSVILKLFVMNLSSQFRTTTKHLQIQTVVT